jgi:hypothetical protein
MTEQVVIRDIDDTQTDGYMLISQHLGKIRTFCLPDTLPQNLSADEAFKTIDELLQEIERAVSRFEHSFSGRDRESMKTYLQQVKYKLDHWCEHKNGKLSAMLGDIYRFSTELRVSLGVFTMIIPKS